jgi:hypothetical protein
MLSRHFRLSPLLLTALLGFSIVDPAWAIPVTVKVLSSGGKPVAGAKAIVAPTSMKLRLGSAHEVQAITDTQGLAKFNLQPGVLGPEGYGNVTVVTPEKSICFDTVGPGQNTIRLGKTVTIRGRILDEAGDPVAGARVSLQSLGTRRRSNGPNLGTVDVPLRHQEVVSTRSDADGKWSIGGLPSNGYGFLELRDEPFIRDVAYWLGDQIKREVVFRARPGGAIIGRVVNQQGKPLPRIAVFAADRSRESVSYGSGTTDASGKFRIGSLAETNSLSLNAYVPMGMELVQPGTIRVAVEQKAITKVPDIVLVSGTPIQGQITDLTTGKGLPGVLVMATFGKGGMSAYSMTLSGIDGNYRMRVMPGDVSLRARLSGYGISSQGGDLNPLTFKIVSGVKPVRDIALKPILPLKGVAVDVTGKPIPHAQFRIAAETVTADKNGHWTSPKIDYHTARIGAGGDWTLVRPRQVKIPATGPIRVVLRRPTFRKVSGRVVSSEGKPLRGVKVSLEANGGYSSSARKDSTVTTSPDGRFIFTKVPEGSRPYGIVAQLDGYVPVSTPSFGDFKANGKDWSAKDSVLAQAAPPLEGKVFRADGTPATGAFVVANRGAAKMARTDQQGTFTLSKLIGGDVKLIAFEGNEAASASFHIPSNTAPRIVLKPVSKLPSRDVNRAYDLLVDVAAQRGFWARDDASRMLDKYDPTLAGKLYEAAGRSKNIILRNKTWGGPQVFALMLMGPKDPVLHTGEPLVPIEEAQRKPFSAYLEAAQGLETFEKEKGRATELLDSAEATLRSMTSEERAAAHYETILAFGLTGALASRLNRPSAVTWRDFALTLLDRHVPGGYGSPDDWKARVFSLAMYGGPESYALYEAEVDANARIRALSDTIRRTAPSQTEEALALFQKLEALYNSEKLKKSRNSSTGNATAMSKAMVALSKSLAASQPKRALAIAERIPDQKQRSLGLAWAAAGLSGDARIDAYNEAFLAAGQYGLDQKAFVAALAADVDPLLGKALFEKVLKVAEPMSRSGISYIVIRDVAFYLGRSDPGAARQLLEQSLAYSKFRARSGSNMSVESVAVAMASVDFARAVELCNEIKDMHQACTARVALAKFALATEEQRRELNFFELSR